MKRCSIWFSALLVSASGPALAVKWTTISEGATRAVYLDSDSLQRSGPDVRVWTRETFTDEQRSPHTGALYFSSNALLRFDCAKRSSVPMLRIFYGSDGTELRRINLDAVELPSTVAPGSIQERLLERACVVLANRPVPAPIKAALANFKSKSEPPALPGAASTPLDGKAAKDTAKPAAELPTEVVKPLAEAPKPVVEEKSETRAKIAPIAQIAPSSKISKVKFTQRKVENPELQIIRIREQIKLAAAGKRKVAVRAEKAPEIPEIHWSYQGAGAPQTWGDLKPDYAACRTGRRQSPIDIQDGAKLELEPIKFDYKPVPLRIIDNGHTVQVNYPEGNSIMVAGVRYDLRQLHFHRPSEERINGKVYDMVVHLVHQSAEGRYAVVAIVMEMGASNPFIASLWPHLPLEAGRELALPDVTIDLNTLLPEPRTYFAYMGSLTTPPCTEGVLWLVLKTPVSVSNDQVGVFGKLYSMNARPVQPANGRLIKESL
ncbi:MAG: carbonic anhydrase family protein [Betaproteobacteria bacterium]